MNRRCVYYVEGECERQLINSLKEQPGMVVPGKVKVYNVIQKLIPKSQLLTIQKDSIVVFLIDTDVDETKYLSQNIDRIRITHPAPQPVRDVTHCAGKPHGGRNSCHTVYLYKHRFLLKNHESNRRLTD